ncbi:MAG: hypothetical protein VB115_15160 [Christensenellaceae bacterium]|nr:hypothetical protein [Christensenellaceae bacterium]
MQVNQWWMEEEPQTVETPRNVLRWYPGAGKLQLSRPDRDGSVGKTVTLDVGIVRKSGQGANARAILQAVMDALEA